MRWLAAVLLLGNPAGSAGGSTDLPRIRITGDQDYPPIEYLQDGAPAGMLVEILAALEAETDLRFDIVLAEWQEAQRRVLTGEVDAIGVMSITDARLEDYEFTAETIELTYSLFVRQDDLRIRHVEDLRGKRVGVTAGGYPRQLLGTVDGAQLVMIDGYAAGFQQLLQGELDAVAADTWVGAYTLQQNGIHEVHVSPGPFATLRAGLAVRKGDTATLERLDAGLAELRGSGTLDRIESAWSSQEVLYVTKARVRATLAVAAAGLLVLAIAAAILWIASLRRQIQRKTVLLREANDLLEARVKERTRELQHSEERWRLLLQTAPVLVVVLDTNNKILDLNAEAERVLGVQAAAVRGVVYLERFVPPERRQSSRDAIRDINEHSRLDGFENEVIAADGTRRWISWNSCQLPATANEPVRLLGVGFDVTERRRDAEARRGLEDQLRQAESLQTIGRLAGGVAHDFNNQLAGIISFASLLLPHQASGEDREACEMILRAARTSSALTRQLLTLARKGKPRLEPVDVHALLREAAVFFRGSLPKSIAVETQLGADRADVVGDAPLLQSSFLNLAVNARDAMPEGGRLTISTEIRNGSAPPMLLVRFADTGLGMAPDVLRRAFEPFFTTKAHGHGSGLGLALVRGTVESHGGTVELASEEGKGSVITVALPLQDAPHRAPAPVRAAGPAALRGTPRILVVDDDAFVRNATSLVLKKLGGVVTACEDGRSAIELLERDDEAFDVVLMDLDMPTMSGREALRAMRAVDPDVRVVFASGYASAGAAASAEDPEPSAAIEKPFEPETLATVLNAVLAVKD